MFKALKFRKLHNFLQSCKIIRVINEKLDYDQIIKHEQFFTLKNQTGKQNCKRLLEILYEKNPAPIRIKILIFIHYLITSNQGFEQFFLAEPRKIFDGPEIKRKQYLVTNVNETRGLESSCITKRSTTRRNIDQDVNYTDVNVYLHLNLVIPYFSYLMKLGATFQFYQSCKKAQNSIIQNCDFNLIWKIINTIKGILYVREILTYMGRYYYKNTQYIVNFIEAICCDFNIYYTVIEKHMSKAIQLFQQMPKEDMELVLTLLDEVHDLNEGMFEVYFNRYYHHQTKYILPPKWFKLQTKQTQNLINFYYNKFDITIINKKKHLLQKQKYRQDLKKLQDSEFGFLNHLEMSLPNNRMIEQ